MNSERTSRIPQVEVRDVAGHPKRAQDSPQQIAPDGVGSRLKSPALPTRNEAQSLIR